MFLGRDKFYPFWNGKIAHFRLHFGRGAFLTEKFSHQENFAFTKGSEELL